MALLGGVQGGDLPGQIVVPRPGGELVDAQGHNLRSRNALLRRPGRRRGNGKCKEVCGTSNLEIGRGYAKPLEIVVMTAGVVGSCLRGVKGGVDEGRCDE
jgi:hypothetical protein